VPSVSGIMTMLTVLQLPELIRVTRPIIRYANVLSRGDHGSKATPHMVTIRV